MVYSIYGDDIEKIEQELLEIYDKDSLASLNVMEPGFYFIFLIKIIFFFKFLI